MLKVVKVIVAVMALVALAGAYCKKKPADGGGSSSGREPVGSPDFLVLIGTKAVDGREVRRDITCVVSGFAADGVLFTVLDTETGDERPFVNTITEHSPARVRIKNHAGVVRIEVVCFAALQKGETILCEFLDRNGRRPAPMFKSKDFGEAERRGSGFRATCSASINAIA